VCGQRQSEDRVSKDVSWERSHTDKANIWQACLPNKQVMGTVQHYYSPGSLYNAPTSTNRRTVLSTGEMTATKIVSDLCRVQLRRHADRSHIANSHLSGLLETCEGLLIPNNNVEMALT
jgi:hypothetical protein